jgi:prepilin-type processing-associated H-X9-DG protein
LLHEPPAKRWEFEGEYSYVHWHYARGPSDISQQQLKTDGQKFISTILFVDGHAAKHDFSSRIKGDPLDIYERTKDWIWYKPAVKDQ